MSASVAQQLTLNGIKPAARPRNSKAALTPEDRERERVRRENERAADAASLLEAQTEHLFNVEVPAALRACRTGQEMMTVFARFPQLAAATTKRGAPLSMSSYSAAATAYVVARSFVARRFANKEEDIVQLVYDIVRYDFTPPRFDARFQFSDEHKRLANDPLVRAALQPTPDLATTNEDRLLRKIIEMPKEDVGQIRLVPFAIRPPRVAATANGDEPQQDAGDAAPAARAPRRRAPAAGVSKPRARPAPAAAKPAAAAAAKPVVAKKRAAPVDEKQDDEEAPAADDDYDEPQADHIDAAAAAAEPAPSTDGDTDIVHRKRPTHAAKRAALSTNDDDTNF